MITPISSPEKVLSSLTKEELVDLILWRVPFGEREDIKRVYWRVLNARFDKTILCMKELLEQSRRASDLERQMALGDEIDTLQEKLDHILNEMEAWA